MDEKLLIRKILKGDTSSFGYFVDNYQNMAINIAHRICSNQQDAEDIVQNSFVKAFHNLYTFHIDSKFSTWFYRIVYNTSLTHIGSTKLNNEYTDYQVMETDESDFDILTDIYEKERKEIINRAMDKMPKDESLILTLFYLEENSIKDISSITSLSESNIKVKLHRSRKRLKDILASIIKKRKDSIMKKIDKLFTEQDKLFREIISETRIETGDNLKFRIMQQIETEISLKTKQIKTNTYSILKSILTVLGIMYFCILVIILGTYMILGENSLKSVTLQLTIISITSICSVICFIFVYDERKRDLRKHQIK